MRAVGQRLTVGLAVAGLLAVGGCPTEDPPDDLPPIVDPLSRPAEPTLSVGSFLPASECVACHPDHVARWESSSHAYAMVDPVFRALVEVRRADHDGAQDTFCLQCHTAIGTRGGEIVPGFAWEQLSPVVREGVTCEACHKVSALERTWNSGHVLDEGGPMYGPLQAPDGSAPHEHAYSELHTTSEFCAGCHEVIELDGLPLERPYSEWLESPSADDGQTCQDCHMPTYQGPAAEGGDPRTLHDHRFVGIDVPLTEDFASPEQIAEVRGRVLELLDGAASLSLQAEPVAPGATLNLVATVHNNIPRAQPAHRLHVHPTDVAGRGGARRDRRGPLPDGTPRRQRGPARPLEHPGRLRRPQPRHLRLAPHRPGRSARAVPMAGQRAHQRIHPPDARPDLDVLRAHGGEHAIYEAEVLGQKPTQTAQRVHLNEVGARLAGEAVHWARTALTRLWEGAHRVEHAWKLGRREGRNGRQRHGGAQVRVRVRVGVRVRVRVRMRVVQVQAPLSLSLSLSSLHLVPGLVPPL